MGSKDWPGLRFSLILLTALLGAQLALAQSNSSTFLPSISLLLLSDETKKSDLIFNEIDYDQPGDPDSAEFIELLNTGNGKIDLAGLAVILIDGDTNTEYARFDLSPLGEINAGQYLVIASSNLSERIPESAHLIEFPQSEANIENAWGGTEGGTFPLGDAVILFDEVEDNILSGHAYEGDLTNATIVGSSQLVSLIGTVSDTTSSNGREGSVARIPNGQNTQNDINDFRFPAIPTPGMANRFFYGLLINEVDYDNVGLDDSEFVEIFNANNFPINLEGLSLVFIDGGTSTEYGPSIELDALQSLGASSYLVVGAPTVTNALDSDIRTIAFALAENNIRNGAPDAIVLFDRVTNTVVDALSYEGSITNATIAAVPGFNLVNGTATSAIDPGNTGAGSLVRQPNGRDTNDDNTDWGVLTIPTPGAANTDYAGLVINEIDYDQVQNDTEEFIEIYNSSNEELDLTGVAVILVNGTNNTEYARYDLGSLGNIAANGLAVVGSTAVLTTLPSGVGSIPTTSPIQNGPDGVALFHTSYNILIDALSYETPFINAANIIGVTGTFNLVSGTGTTAADPNDQIGVLRRVPDGAKTGNDIDDWQFSGTPSPGELED